MPQPSLSTYHPSLGERLQQGFAGLLGKVVNQRYANHLGERLFSAINDLTPVGNVTMAADAGTAIRNGHPFKGLGLGALAVLPGAAGKVAKKGVGKIGRGMFGNSTAERMRRAEELGYTVDAYHGTTAGDIGEAFDPAKVRDNIQYGGNFYFSPTPEYANKYADGRWAGESPTVYPVKLRIQKPFHMDQEVGNEDVVRTLEALGQHERAAQAKEGGWTFRNGSEFFYWGMGHHLTADDKAKALRAAGFDGIIGDPAREIVGKPGRPHIMVFEPNQIRSRFADFDPAKANSPRLSD